MADLGESLQLDSSYAKAYLRRGLCYVELELWDEAVTDFSMASTRDPFNLEIAVPFRGVRLYFVPQILIGFN